MAFVNLLQAVYPVGSVYLSTVGTSPSSIIGGTWVAMTGGMIGLVGSTGVASAANNGGSLTISTNQMPSHSHGALQNTHADDYCFTLNRTWNTDAVGRMAFQMSSSSNYKAMGTNTSASDSVGIEDISQATSTATAGGGQNFIPAHTAVYGWRRTA